MTNPARAMSDDLLSSMSDEDLIYGIAYALTSSNIARKGDAWLTELRRRYEGLVEKLPKTADGVWCIPGRTRLFFVSDFGSHGLSITVGYPDRDEEIAKGYSTSEAAEAALAAQREAKENSND